MAHGFKNEAELAAVVVDWLRDQMFDVYQEVKNPFGRADIVAVAGPITWVIETKMTLGFGVFDQALKYVGRANYVSVASPTWGYKPSVDAICKAKGVGVLQVTGYSTVRECYAPRLYRTRRNDIIANLNVSNYLCDEQKLWGTAGSKSDFYSPFKGTCREISSFVSRNNGCTLKELLAGINTHYISTATAKSLIPKYIDMGLVPQVTLDRNERALRLIYTPPTPTVPASEPDGESK